MNFARLTIAFGGKTGPLSSMRRIQRFMSDYEIDLSIVGRMVFNLLPYKCSHVFAMDRTCLRVGWFDINTLVLAVTYMKVAFPLLFRLLSKKGNSSTAERIGLMERYNFCAFHSLKSGQSMHFHGIYLVKCQYCYISAARMKNRDDKPELQILLFFNRLEESVETYKSRWQIKTCFKLLKSSGFNL